MQHPKIDVNKGNKLKQTPLHVACLNGSKAVVMELLKHQNIQLNATDNNGATPLHFACLRCDSVAVVELILEHGTIKDLNKADVFGKTPLHNICSANYFNDEKINIIKHLLKQKSIMIYKKNYNGNTHLDICKERLLDPKCDKIKEYYREIIRLFEDYRIQQHQRHQQRWRVYCSLIMPSHITM